MAVETSPERLEISVQARNELDTALNDAVELIRPAAAMKRAGIRISRTATGRYEISLCNEVPFGMTMEFWDLKPTV